MMHVYFGNGKGKTSRAVGMAIRYAGSGGKVLFAQFLKDGSSSETNVISDVKNISYICVSENLGFFWNMTQRQKEIAKQKYTKLFETAVKLSSDFDMLILDELSDAIDCGFLDYEYILPMLDVLKSRIEIVITGHKMPQQLIDMSDYASEVEKVKHPYDNGVAARKGIEF